MSLTFRSEMLIMHACNQRKMCVNIVKSSYFGHLEWHTIIIFKVLYCLRSSRLLCHKKFADTFYHARYALGNTSKVN